MGKKGNGVRVPHEPRNKLMKRFTLPDGLDCKEFVMRELDGNDELEAAIWADRKLSSAQRDNPIAVMGAEAREARRKAMVEVDGRSVNGEVPFTEMDRWSMRTMRFVIAAFHELNAVEDDEIKNFRAGARVVTPARTEEGPGTAQGGQSAG